MKHEEMVRETVVYHIREANRALQALYQATTERTDKAGEHFDPTRMNEEVLGSKLEEIYHHLTIAWNARHYTLAEATAQERRFAKWPRAARFLRFWPDRWIRAIRKAHQKGVQTRRNSKH